MVGLSNSELTKIFINVAKSSVTTLNQVVGNSPMPQLLENTSGVAVELQAVIQTNGKSDCTFSISVAVSHTSFILQESCMKLAEAGRLIESRVKIAPMQRAGFFITS